MKVIKSIRITKDTIDTLKRLDVVENVSTTPSRNIVVRLKPELTEGKLEAAKNEYLVQWESGKWQRYGSIAYDLLFHNPQSIYRD